MYVMICIYIGLLAAWDMCKKSIPLMVVLFGIVGGCVISFYRMAVGLVLWPEILASIVPGAFLLLLSYLTKEQIGYGDGMVLLGQGLFLGWKCAWFALVVGQLAASICVLVLLVSRKISKNASVAYVPFLLLGTVLARVVMQ